MTGWLLDIWWCNSVFNSHNTDMLITDPDMYIFVTWYLTLDIWHLYLTCYYLIPDTGCLTLILDILSLDTWYLTLNIWHLIIDMLSLDTWHMLSLGTDTLDQILWHMTGYYYTWHLYYIAYDYTFTGTWHDYYNATT